jgi:hypothetical protein
MMTPIRAEVPRKGTPFKPQEQQPVVSSRKSKKFPPLPQTELTVKSPYKDFGSEAECEPLGDPVAGGGMRELFDFNLLHDKFARKPSETHQSFFDSREPPTSSSELEQPEQNDEGIVQPTKKQRVVEAVGFTCHKCGTANGNDVYKCTNCDEKRKVEIIGWGGAFAGQKKLWKCTSCLTKNGEKYTVCLSCEVPRKGHEGAATSSAGGASTTSGGIGLSGFTFGTAPVSAAEESSTGGGFKSGRESSSTSAFDSGSTGGFTFGGSFPPPATGTGGAGFTFGGSSPTASTDKAAASPSASSGFSFRGAAPAPSDDEMRRALTDQEKQAFKDRKG